MTTVETILRAVDAFAPFANARETDNCGLLCGAPDTLVTKALVVMDVTRAIVEEAAEAGAELIVAHHPAIYAPVKRLTAENPVYHAARHGIALLSAHTNLDVAPGGVNDCFLAALGLERIGAVEGTDGCVALAALPAALSDIRALAARVKEAAGLHALRYVASEKPLTTAAVCCGGGASFFDAVAASGAAVFISGDFRLNHATEAARCGLALIDAGHYETERVYIAPFVEKMNTLFPDVYFSAAKNDRPFFTYM